MVKFKAVSKAVYSVIMSLVMCIVSILTTGGSVKNKEPEKIPTDFSPVVRFIACSDVHVTTEENQVERQRFEKMMKTAYAYSKSQSYDRLDAVAVVGDFTNRGERAQYEVFKDLTDKTINSDETSLLICTGNHEYYDYRDNDRSEGNRVFEEFFGSACAHKVIGGYHFITLSYDSSVETYLSRLAWLKAELDKAVADTGDKPIFVFQHTAPKPSTLYGTKTWGDPTFSAVLAAYPQVVDFSGHSHYPINDPRSIAQDCFTALQCGTLSYFECEIDYDRQTLEDKEQAAQFYVVEADANGNVAIKPYDLITESFFENNEYYLTDLANKNFPYSYINRASLDFAPVFAADSSVSQKQNESGQTILTFDGAQDKYIVESYRITVTQGKKTVFASSVFGNYMFLAKDETVCANLGKLESGKEYKVKIIAANAYGKLSESKTYTFTAQ